MCCAASCPWISHTGLKARVWGPVLCQSSVFSFCYTRQQLWMGGNFSPPYQKKVSSTKFSPQRCKIRKAVEDNVYAAKVRGQRNN